MASAETNRVLFESLAQEQILASLLAVFAPQNHSTDRLIKLECLKVFDGMAHAEGIPEQFLCRDVGRINGCALEVAIFFYYFFFFFCRGNGVLGWL